MASHDSGALPRNRSSTLTSESKALLDHANALLSQGKLKESESVLRQIVELYPTAPEGFYGLGLIQLKRGDTSGAASLFEKCVGLDPLNDNAYCFLGEIWERRNLPEVALGFFRKALEINPGRRGLRERVQRLNVNKPPGTSRPARQGVASAPSTGEFGIYEYIRNDTSPLGQQTLRLMDTLALKSITPRLSASFGPIAGAALVALLVPLTGLNLLPLMFGARIPYSRSDADNIALFFIIIGMLLLFRMVLIILKVKTTRITLDKGRLQISKGIFNKKQQNYELYRIEDIELRQTFINRMTHDGTLVLHVAPGHGQARSLELAGIAEIDRLRVLFDQLRNLVLLLRTGAWGKGVIY